MVSKKQKSLIEKNYQKIMRKIIDKKLKKLNLKSNHKEQEILILYGSFDRIELDIIDDISETEYFNENEKRPSLEDFF